MHRFLAAVLARGKRQLKGRIAEWRPAKASDGKPLLIRNVNRERGSARKPRALLLYVARAFGVAEDDPQVLRHQDVRTCRYIARLLGEFDYVVDLVDGHLGRTPHPERYALILSARDRPNDPMVAFRPDAIKIFLATVQHHSRHNQNLRRRHADLQRRRTGSLVEQRRIYSEELPFPREADAIFTFGNDRAAATWKDTSSGVVFPFNNFWFRETRPVIDGKDFESARRRSLFFASRSQIMKGLDLLLEIFPRHPNLHLYVCSQFESEPDFVACYQRELHEMENVHPVGWIDATGAAFYELAARCAYVVHPACSEGQPGSVIQCMAAGLIPLVTAESFIDTGEFGLTFANDSIEELERTIVEVSRLPAEWHRERAQRTRDVAEREYSEQAFVDRWREMLGQVLGRPGGVEVPG